ncbi:hypothetical protein ACRRTK_007766 [Alexandromys fortis]
MVSTTGLGWIGVRSQALVRCGDARATSALSRRRPGGRCSPAQPLTRKPGRTPVAGSLPDPLKAGPWAELRADQVISGAEPRWEGEREGAELEHPGKGSTQGPEVTEGEARLAEGRIKPSLRRRMHAKGEGEPQCNRRKEHSRKVERYPGALPKACIIFSKVRQGKINVNDLPMILHILKISMSDSEMRQVLKTTDIDEFQDVLKTFSKMKGGRVATDEVAAFLDGMGIPVNPETLKDVISHSYVDSNYTVDIGDIIFALDDLQQQYEDVCDKVQLDEFSKAVKDMRDTLRLKEDNTVSVKDCMEALRDNSKFSSYNALKEAIDTLDSMKGGYQSDKDSYLEGVENAEGFIKEALSSHLKLPTISEIQEAADSLSHVDNGKISVSNLEHALKSLHANLSEEDFRDALEHCDTGDNMEVNLKDFLEEVKSAPSFKDSIVTQLLLATPQILQKDLIDVSDFKELLVNDNLHSAKAVLTEVLKNVPEHEEGKVTVKDFIIKFGDTLTALKSEREKEQLYNADIDRNNANAISDIKENVRKAIGIDLTDSEVQKALDNTTPSSEMVQLKDIIRGLANTDIFNECQRIEDTSNIVDKITDEKVEVKDLLSVIKSFEKSLQEKDKPGEFPTSEMDGLLKEITSLDNIRKNKMAASELVSNIMSTGIPISHDTMQEILKQASVNGEEADVTAVDEALRNRDTGLTDEEEKILFEPLPALDDEEMDMETLIRAMMMFKDDGKISQLQLMDIIKSLKRGKADTTKLDNILAKMEEQLTSKEVQHLPVDKGKVDVSELDTILEKMGMDFSDEPSEGLVPSWHASECAAYGPLRRRRGTFGEDVSNDTQQFHKELVQPPRFIQPEFSEYEDAVGWKAITEMEKHQQDHMDHNS